MLNDRDDRVWPMHPEIKSTILRARAARARRQGWLWWMAALALFVGALLVAPEYRVIAVLIAAVPGIMGLYLFAAAQDLLDDAMERDL